ncbi:MAG: T9SS type A sorting domain-containing protein [Saprospiraceae bacterium]|nr:T9SS type A sorting domain-containing protein [Saprospiraceae bacterium]
MRHHLKNHPYIQSIQLPVYIGSGDPIPNVSGDLVIESGIHIIDQPLFMMPGAKITVKPGARLKIYAKITSACDDQMWEGSVVEGNPLGALANTGGQGGQVSIYDDGVIEHARVGVRLGSVGGTGQQLTSGGLLFPCKGTFINCTISVKFEANPASFNTGSQIFPADFILDGNYLGGSGQQPIFIDAFKVTGLSVKSSFFKDNRSVCGASAKAIGINAKATSVIATGNSFENLAKGIVVDQSLYGSFQANSNDFVRCYTGIETNKISNFAITGNDFQIATPAGCTTEPSVGVLLSGNTAGFKFSKNTFTGLSTDKTRGVVINGTQGGIGNRIFDNDYANLEVGNLAEGNNGGDEGGMTYVCNTHATSFDDYLVTGSVRTQQSGIDPNTGGPIAAGNLFSGIPQEGSFNNAGSAVQYFYLGPQSTSNPEYFGYSGAVSSGVLGVIRTKPNSTCTAAPTPCNPCPPTESEVLLKKTDYYEKRQERDTRKAALATMTNPAAIQAEKDSIANLKRLMEFNASFVAQAFAQDTSGAAIQSDSIMAWLERSETYAGDLERLNHYFFTGDLKAFEELQNELPNKYDLAGEDLGEFEELGVVYDLLRPTIEEEESLSDLDTGILDSLKFWRSWCSEPGFLAKSIMRWNGIETVQDCVTPQRTTVRNAPSYQKQKNNSNGDDIVLYPNPAQNSITVIFENQPENGFDVILFDMQGNLRMVEHYKVAESKPTIDINGLPSGFYLIEIRLVEKQEPVRRKLIVCK